MTIHITQAGGKKCTPGDHDCHHKCPKMFPHHGFHHHGHDHDDDDHPHHSGWRQEMHSRRSRLPPQVSEDVPSPWLPPSWA